MLVGAGAKHNPIGEEVPVSSTAHQPAFGFQHHSWSAVRPVQLGDRVACRRVRGGASESFFLELGVGGGVSSPGIPAECTLTVIEGRLTCRVFGNEVELARGNYAVIPPNVPLSLRVAGRSPAACVLFAAARLGDPLPLEAS